MDDIFETIAGWRGNGERVALATVIRVEGSAPRDEGAKMAIGEHGKVVGSVSGGCVESAVAQEAQSVLASGVPKIVRYGIDRQMMWDVGLSCGGQIDVFIEPASKDVPRPQAGRPGAVCTVVRGPDRIGAKFLVEERGAAHEASGAERLALPGLAREALAFMRGGRSGVVESAGYEVFVDVYLPQPQLVIVGAVHIAISLCEMASQAGFAVSIVDPRPTLCNRDRFPSARELMVAWPEDALPKIRFDEDVYVAVLTHDEKFDDPTLLHVLPTKARYVGAIGSKKTQAKRRQRLLDAGIAQRDVDRLRGPIGLDIGAQSPEEIAVSILAEMIASKHRASGIALKDREGERIHA